MTTLTPQNTALLDFFRRQFGGVSVPSPVAPPAAPPLTDLSGGTAYDSNANIDLVRGLIQEMATPSPVPPPPPEPEPWNQWFKTNVTAFPGFVEDQNAWARRLSETGFPGQITYRQSRDNGGGEVLTEKARQEVERQKALGYNFLYNPSTHNNYQVAVTPQGTYKLNTEGTSFLQGIAPVLGVLAAPLTGGLSAALGGGAVGTIAANALVQGGLGSLSGGDFLESALRGAVTGGIGSVVNPIASSIGADVLNTTDSKFLSDIVSGAVKGVPGALMSGDASNLLTGAVTGAVGSQVGNELGLTPPQSQVATNIASKLLQGGDLSLSDIVKIGTSYAPGPAMPGTTGNEITEGFFEPGGPGFMPTEYLDDAEVDRELQSLLGRYPAPPPPSDWFLGENIASGIPEWDMAAVNAGLPIGNLEQDFMVNERGQIVDNAGNVGNFVNGEFVVDTGVTPDLSYAATNAPAPAPSAAPGKAPAPKAQSGFDPRLFSFLMGMMNQDEDKPDSYQVAQINTPSPFGTIYDQQQDLLGLMGRG